MAAIKTEQQYDVAIERIEELLRVVGNETPSFDKNFIELDFLSDLVADYEAVHYQVRMPTLPELIKSGMNELKINQEKLAEMLNITSANLSNIMRGKKFPSFRVARKLHKTLKIDGNLILG